MPRSPKKVVKNAIHDLKWAVIMVFVAGIMIGFGALIFIWVDPYRAPLLAQLFGIAEWQVWNLRVVIPIMIFLIAGFLILFQMLILAKHRQWLMEILDEVPEKATKSDPDQPTEGKKQIEVSSSVPE
jgi:hypothetical protein